MKYRMDPDFRRDPPKDGTPYCVCCQKALTFPTAAQRVTVDWDTWVVTKGGKELMGHDCWAKTLKNPVSETASDVGAKDE